MPDFVPHKDSDCLAFSKTAHTKLASAPASYGLVAADLTNLNTANLAFEAALAVCTNPATKTAVATASKDTARVSMVAILRSIARRVQAFPSVTPAMKIEIGLPVRDGVPSPI